MVGVSYDQKPYRRAMIETWGATVHRSPSRADRGRPLAGRARLRAASGSRSPRRSRSPPRSDDTNYSLGSVLNHVCLHQTVIGQECLDQMELAGEYPDVVIGCVGGGSNFAGLAFPFLRRKLRDGARHALPRGRARGLPDPDPRRVPLRLRRHRRDDPADADVHARPRLRAAAASTPAACATTATRRWSRPRQGGPGRGDGDPADATAFEAAVRFAGIEGILPAPEPATRSGPSSTRPRRPRRRARSG